MVASSWWPLLGVDFFTQAQWVAKRCGSCSTITAAHESAVQSTKVSMSFVLWRLERAAARVPGVAEAVAPQR